MLGFASLTKALAVAVVGAALAGSLVGCSQAPVSSTPTPVDYKVCLMSDRNGFSDNGVNQAAYYGLLQSEAELGPRTSSIELHQGDDSTKIAKSLETLVKRNCSLIFAVGQENVPAVRASANRHPSIEFALIDASFVADDGTALDRPNVTTLSYDTTLAALQAGYLAASKTKNSMVGLIGDVASTQTVQAISAFRAGVKYYNQTHQTTITVVGADSPDFTNWRLIGANPTAVRVAANVRDLLSSGASVVIGVNVSAAGVAKAFEQHPGALMIGWNADLYNDPAFTAFKPILLASVQKSVSQELVYVTKLAMTGALVSGVITKDSDGNPLASLTNEHDVPFGDGIAADLEKLTAAIASNPTL